MWPFRKPAPVEKRQAGPFTDAITRRIIEQRTTAAPDDAGDTAALEMAAGMIGRAFMSARVSVAGAESDTLPPALLGDIGRDLVMRGEAVVVEIGRTYHRATTWDVAGRTPDKARWSYRCEIPAPDGHVNILRMGSDVAHPRWSCDAETPWDGVAPMERATAAARLAGSMETRTADEAGGVVGHLLPIPGGAEDANVAALKADLKRLAGDTALVETTAAAWGQGRGEAPQSDWKPQRIGSMFPQSTEPIYRASQKAVLAACGVPIELVERADGTGQREAWRRCLHSTIEPLGRIVAAELTWVVGRPVMLDFEALFASDIQGRARAFQSMVAAGMDVATAAAKSGLMDMD